MAVPASLFTRSGALSRRDHVLNLLPPLSVVTKDEVTMHERLFADDLPPKNYPQSFPNKVLRHLGPWTFYSAPTRGELALIDKNMYDVKVEANVVDKIPNEKKKRVPETGNKKVKGKAHQLSEHAQGTVKMPETMKKVAKAKAGKEKQGEGSNAEKNRGHKSSLGLKTASTSKSPNLRVSEKEQVLELKREVSKLKRDKGSSTVKQQSRIYFQERRKEAKMGRRALATVAKFESKLQTRRAKLLGHLGEAKMDSELAVEGYPVHTHSYQKIREGNNNLPRGDNKNNRTGPLTRKDSDNNAKNLKAVSSYHMYAPGSSSVPTRMMIEISLLRLHEEKVVETPEEEGERLQYLTPVLFAKADGERTFDSVSEGNEEAEQSEKILSEKKLDRDETKQGETAEMSLDKFGTDLQKGVDVNDLSFDATGENEKPAKETGTQSSRSARGKRVKRSGKARLKSS